MKFFSLGPLLLTTFATAGIIHLGRVKPTLNEEIQAKKQKIYDILPRAAIEDANLDVPQLIEKYGYPVETHYVTTIDGYILCLHRIPYGKDGWTGDRTPFFVQHGILSSSADWIIAGPEKGLGYILADAGYDVWMGNFRGNKYSRNHTYLHPDKDEEQFWNFSWHELGIRDLPAMIDYVSEKTGHEKMLHVGHSQGTTTFYVMCSELPEYNDKILAHISLAPIAYMYHMISPLMKILSFFNGPLEVLFEMIGVYEFLPNDGFMGFLGDAICEDSDFTQVLCTNALFAICGFSPNQMNATLLPILMAHTPAGSSTKQFLHYAQLASEGYNFRMWNYGLFGNLQHYGSVSPPHYNLGNVVAPTYLIYSENDWLAARTDVERLYKDLGNSLGKFLVGDSKWNHLDYMYGIDAPDIAYSKVISLAAKYKNNNNH